MVSALLYLLMEPDTDNEGGNSCMQILNTMYKLMEQTRSADLLKKKDLKYRPVQKEDLFDLLTNSSKKYEIEKSHCYIGYKLLWIIKMFLEGKKFPYGDLTET